jgi:pimeloyl-ACP methyl ester carboxylesterase
MLSVTASDDSLGLWWRGQYTLADYRERIQVVPRLTEARIEDAGHMLHHDQPEALAQLLDRFLE